MTKRLLQEKEISTARWEQKWSLVPTLLRALSSKGSTTTKTENDLYQHVLHGEVELESLLITHLQNTNADDESLVFIPMERKVLKVALEHLNEAVSTAKELENVNVAQKFTAVCLLAKANFVSGNYEGALRYLNELEFKDINYDAFPKRDQLLLSEAAALKGLSMEYVAAIQDSQCVFENVASCYLLSTEIALLVLTEVHKFGSLKRNPDQEPVPVDIGVFISTAFVRYCQILLIMGSVHEAINFCRQVLQATESRSTLTLRKRITLELAHMLLTGISSSTFHPPANEMRSRSCSAGESHVDSFQTSSAMSPSLSSSFNSRLLHKKEGLFCPNDELEEAILVLLLNESMILHSCQSADQQTLKKALPSTTRMYGLLALALQQRGQLMLLSESLEKGLKVSCNDFHLWFQFGISLSCAGKFQHSLFVLNHCLKLQEENCMVLLQCAKLCINHLSKFQEALNYSMKAQDCADNQFDKANALLACGISSSLLSNQASHYDAKLRLQQQAIDYTEKAYELDSNDDEICFHLAFCQASSHKLSASLKSIGKCLSLNPYHLHCLHLLALVISAKNKYGEALEVIDSTLAEYPEDFGLLQTKLKLVEACHGGKNAVSIGQQMLEIWSLMYDTEDGMNGQALTIPLLSGAEKPHSMNRMTRTASDSFLLDATKSLKQMTLAADTFQQDGTDDDTSSSIPVSVRLERELSDAVSGTISSGSIVIETALTLLTKIWEAIADTFLNIDDVTNASLCIQEASSVFPLSPDVLYLRGKLNDIQGNYSEAKACYDSALAISPTHAPTLQNLGILNSATGDFVLAEKYLRDSLDNDPSIPAVWHELGIVLSSTGEHTEASSCFNTAIELEKTCPIVSYTCIPRLLRGGS